MKKFIFIILLLTFFLFSLRLQTAFAQQTQDNTQNVKEEFYTGSVIKILDQGEKTIAGTKNLYQVLQIQFLDGLQKGRTIIINYGEVAGITSLQKVLVGDTVILQKTENAPNGQNGYVIYDKYRLSSLAVAFVVFLLLVLVMAGWKGLGSILGLLISLAVILFYMLPQILAGINPLQTSIVASLTILFITTYLAHGISKQTTVALFATFISLMFTVWISSFFVNSSKLTGINEETATLLFGPTSHINLQGLLLAGIIIGTLGALNDVTITQSATIFSLAKHDGEASFKKLFMTGFSVGREHIVSLVNTLVLAYAGSALALLLFIVLNPQKIPYWVMLNTEVISDEIIRTLTGSIGLILVVPTVTFFAATMCDRKIRVLINDLIYALFH